MTSRFTGESWRPGGEAGSLGPAVQAELQTSFAKSFVIPDPAEQEESSDEEDMEN